LLGGALADLFGDLHRAEVRTAHRAPASASRSWRGMVMATGSPVHVASSVSPSAACMGGSLPVPGFSVKLAVASPGSPQLFAHHSRDRCPVQRDILPRMIQLRTTARPRMWRCPHLSGSAWMSKMPIRAEVPMCTVYTIAPRPVGWTTP
jgi:hypothetical protein